jgi:hypothetical protein
MPAVNKSLSVLPVLYSCRATYYKAVSCVCKNQEAAFIDHSLTRALQNRSVLIPNRGIDRLMKSLPAGNISFITFPLSSVN